MGLLKKIKKKLKGGGGRNAAPQATAPRGGAPVVGHQRMPQLPTQAQQADHDETPMLHAIAQGLGGGPGTADPGPAYAPHRTLTNRDIKKRKRNEDASAHEVERVKFKKKLEGTDTKRGFFKSDPDKETAEAAATYNIGQEEGDSHMAARAVASSRLDQALGTDVLSEDRFAEVDGNVGVVSPEVAGSAFQWTEWGGLQGGWAANDLDHYERMNQGGVDPNLHRRGKKGRWEQSSVMVDETRDLSNPETQRGLADLQFNDYLSGQIDRHNGNIFINDEGGVKGIDNDMAFGTRDVLERSRVGQENQIHHLPDQIDASTAESFLRMSEQDFVAAVVGDQEDPSRLSQFEVDAAVGRYWTLRAHVEQLAEDDSLVEEWNEDTFDSAINADRSDGLRSYTQRMKLAQDEG